MVVEIKSNVFENIDNLREINYLINVFSDKRRYEFIIDITTIRETELYNLLLDIDKRTIEEYYNEFVLRSFKINYSISIESNDSTFNIEEAKRFFNQPLTILLENSLNDSYFINSIIENFKSRGKKIKRHKENGWLIFGNGGGCTNMPNYVKGYINLFENLPKNNFFYLRCFVLIDSDKKYPNMSFGNEREILLSFLKENNIPFHILEKREMENYLPDEVMATIENNDEYLQTYFRLTATQKDFFDIEKGFNNKNRTSFSTEIQNFYSSVSQNDFDLLRKGLIYINFKSEFPKLFTHQLITYETLKTKTKNQSNPNELENVLDKIAELL